MHVRATPRSLNRSPPSMPPPEFELKDLSPTGEMDAKHRKALGEFIKALEPLCRKHKIVGIVKNVPRKDKPNTVYIYVYVQSNLSPEADAVYAVRHKIVKKYKYDSPRLEVIGLKDYGLTEAPHPIKAHKKELPGTSKIVFALGDEFPPV